MVQNDPSATINALLCAVVVLTLMFYRRGDSRHRPWISRLAWLLTVIYSAVPLAYLCGIYPYSSWATNAARSAAWFYVSNGCLRYPGDLERVTQIINGGQNGIKDRRERYAKAKAALV